MAGDLFRIVKKTNEVSGNFDLKMLLIVGAIVILFFVVVYPMLKKSSEKMSNTWLDSVKSTVSGAADKATNMVNTTIQRMTDYTTDAGCGKPEKKVETMANIQKTSQITATGDLSPATSNDDIAALKTDTVACSKACCSPQWGMEQPKDDRVMPNDLGTKYFPTNYMCNGENPGDHGNGCVCMTNQIFNTLGNRGGNNLE